MNLDTHSLETVAVYEAGVKTYREPITVEPGGIPFAVVPVGVQIEDVERLLRNPIRKRAIVTVHDADSLARYVETQEDGHTAIFADEKAGTITAIMDYHSEEGAFWKEHRATFTPELSQDWQDWMGNNKKPITQKLFAEFIEDHIPNIAQPDGAKVMEVVSFFENNTTTTFKSGINLQNGTAQLTYVEDADHGREGKQTIPSALLLALKPYSVSEPYEVMARLRFRISEGKLSFTYILERPDDVRKNAFGDFVKAVSETTGNVPFMGKAPA